MIKSLFDEDEGKTRNGIEDINQTEDQIDHSPLPDENGLPEIFSVSDTETDNLLEMRPVEYFEGKQTSAILPDEDNITSDLIDAEPNITFTLSNPFEPAKVETPKKEIDEPMLFQMQSKPESTAETARKSGLAMSAAIALFGSVVFLLIIGWFADLLLGTSPWGIIGGIVLGSIVGFFQFFRTTSQILKNND